MKILRLRPLLTLILLFMSTMAPSKVVAQSSDDDGLKKPESWTEFTSYLADGGDLGWWEAKGVTTDVWKTLPAGITYHYRALTRLDETGRQIVRTFTYVDEQGELLSSGSETIVWDDKSKNVIWSVSGFDADQSWADSGRLVGCDGARMVVASEEKAAGETYELRTTIERTGESTRRRTIARTDGGDTPFVQEFTRVNHLIEALGGWDPTGTWVTDVGGVSIINRTTWSADRRCILITEGIWDMSALVPDDSDGERFMKVSGNGIIWFDPATRTIRERYVSSQGVVLDGEILSASKDRIEIRFKGFDAGGVAMDARVVTERRGDQLTTRFSDMTYDGRSRMPDWAKEPMISTLEPG